MTAAMSFFGACPGCDAPRDDSRILFEARSFGDPCHVLQCAQCTLIYKDRHPDAAAMAGTYGSSYVHFSADANAGVAEVNSARQKLSRCLRLLGGPTKGSAARILDIGCGAGEFVRIAAGLGFAAEGIDPNLPAALESPVLRRADPEILPAGGYDVVTLLNVAEHVTDPLRLFRASVRLLRPGGVMLVTCPFGGSWARRGYRQRWVHLALDEHLLFWTVKSLENCVARAGFSGRRSVRIGGSPFPYGFVDSTEPAGHAASAAAPRNPAPRAAHRLQGAAWRLARRVQASEFAGNAVRWLVDASRLGDYLEYAVARGRE